MTPADAHQPLRIRIARRTESFEVRLRYADSERLSISVHPDLRVTAVVPLQAPAATVRRRIEARAGWICQQREAFRVSRPIPVRRRYISGESHLFLGRQYRLRVRDVPVAKPQVKLRGGYIYVEAPRPLNPSTIRDLLRMWYMARARELLNQKCQQWYQRLRSLGIPEVRMRLRTMTSRWGSCTPSGAILLNPELVKLPVQCIDYVVVHELCHLKVLRHSAEFYRYLSRYMPDWRSRKERLDRIRLPT